MKSTLLTSAQRRKKRVRAVIHGSNDRPRISVFKSNKYFYAQAIDDINHRTVASISSLLSKEETSAKKPTTEKLKPVAISHELGKKLAEKLKTLKIEKAVLDRGQYAYKGNVHAFAEGLRENGIII